MGQVSTVHPPRGSLSPVASAANPSQAAVNVQPQARVLLFRLFVSPVIFASVGVNRRLVTCTVNGRSYLLTTLESLVPNVTRAPPHLRRPFL